ncbi:hypothetical protein [Streptomyces sp. NBC_01187]|uniref:hypothetical protein n=1 Tax=Streptomyces sp. NBC_01187 TaxID=2903766 RepID=UPI00386A2AD0|nr:hypothetical protein OG220_24060 [Streptomyces sp. NBC_01187]
MEGRATVVLDGALGYRVVFVGHPDGDRVEVRVPGPPPQAWTIDGGYETGQWCSTPMVPVQVCDVGRVRGGW